MIKNDWRFSIRLPGELKEKADRKAESEGLSTSALIRRLLILAINDGENDRANNKKIKEIET